MISFNPKYEIGEKVYHITPESSQGVIIDISYRLSTGIISYLIAISWDNEVWALGEELSREKIII
jgi:hypothetical protein